MASCHFSRPFSWKTSGLPSLSLKLAERPGRSGVPVTRAWPVTGLRLRHIAVVSVQPIRRICPPSSEQSTFCPIPCVRAQCSAASIPPNASMAHVSSATETTPIFMGWPGVE